MQTGVKRHRLLGQSDKCKSSRAAFRQTASFLKSLTGIPRLN